MLSPSASAGWSEQRKMGKREEVGGKEGRGERGERPGTEVKPSHLISVRLVCSNENNYLQF